MQLPDLTDEQNESRQAAIKFARQFLASDVIDKDRNAQFDREAWRKCAEFGVLAMPIPAQYGGMGLGLTDLLVVMEGLGLGARDQGILFSINAHLWTNSIPILLQGSEEQRRKYLPRLCDGSLIGANASTEADAGSDVFSMRATARRDGDSYILNGTKTFITNATVADVFIVYATVNPALGPMGVTAFIVERDTPGLRVGRNFEKLGLRTSPLGEIVLENCRVPVAQRLGREGRGVGVFDCAMEWERGCILASCLGVMERQLQECIEYARNRRQFGKPIGKYQSVANRIVDMKVRLETSRPLVYRIGALKDANLDATAASALAKLHVSESFVKSSMDAVQVFGGYGYLTEMQLERDLRDSIGSTLYSGTSEIQRNLIARSLGL